jgi:hypothetical protein
MTDQEEIKALQQENFRLRVLLGRAGVSIPPRADLPSDEELEQLIKLVASKYPVLSCSDAREKDQFFNALHFFCFAYRTPDRLATECSFAYWADTFNDWARSRGYDGARVGVKAFTAAAVASGVAHSPIDNFPYINFGLALGSAGGPPSTAWRDTLRTRSLPSPTETQISHKVREHNWA